MSQDPPKRPPFEPTALHAELTVEETVRHYPETLPVFARHEIDLCCGGKLTLAAAAEKHHLSTEALLDELARAAGAKR